MKYAFSIRPVFGKRGGEAVGMAHDGSQRMTLTLLFDGPLK